MSVSLGRFRKRFPYPFASRSVTGLFPALRLETICRIKLLPFRFGTGTLTVYFVDIGRLAVRVRLELYPDKVRTRCAREAPDCVNAIGTLRNIDACFSRAETPPAHIQSAECLAMRRVQIQEGRIAFPAINLRFEEGKTRLGGTSEREDRRMTMAPGRVHFGISKGCH
jgi:hypothetical protein